MEQFNETSMFAPSIRLSSEELQTQVDKFHNNVALRQGYDAINALILIINQYRQVVFANKAFLVLVSVLDVSSIAGKRPGEIVQCIHAWDNPGGCGTSEACRYCQVVNIVLDSIENNSFNAGEVTLRTQTEEAEVTLNLYQSASPLEIDGETFYVVSFVDISDSISRTQMERVFLHDILNTVGGLKGLAGVIKDTIPSEIRMEFDFFEESLSEVTDAIISQRQILDAEKNELLVEQIELDTIEVIEHIVKLFRHHPISKDKQLKISNTSHKLLFTCDYLILNRILGNMVKNALEATKTEGVVTIGCKETQRDDTLCVEFWVMNTQYIPVSQQYRIFQRSFSTKGKGRGPSIR